MTKVAQCLTFIESRNRYTIYRFSSPRFKNKRVHIQGGPLDCLVLLNKYISAWIGMNVLNTDWRKGRNRIQRVGTGPRKDILFVTTSTLPLTHTAVAVGEVGLTVRPFHNAVVPFRGWTWVCQENKTTSFPGHTGDLVFSLSHTIVKSLERIFLFETLNTPRVIFMS